MARVLEKSVGDRVLIDEMMPSFIGIVLSVKRIIARSIGLR